MGVCDVFTVVGIDDDVVVVDDDVVAVGGDGVVDGEVLVLGLLACLFTTPCHCHHLVSHSRGASKKTALSFDSHKRFHVLHFYMLSNQC